MGFFFLEFLPFILLFFFSYEIWISGLKLGLKWAMGINVRTSLDIKKVLDVIYK